MARLAVDAGYDVVLSNSRGPGTLADLVAELGPRARAASGAEAAAIGDLVLVSIPLRGYPSLPAPSFVGKIVLDTGNYYPQRDGRIEALDSGSLTDSEHLAQHLPGARVVKVFNGYGADDGGPLADGWRQQPGTPVYGAPYGEFENEKGTPADAAVIRAALAAASRM